MKPAVFLALGSNIEPRKTFLLDALHCLTDLGYLVAVAPLYESLPYGEPHQSNFLNTAVRMECDLSPHELLRKLKQIEQRLGRQGRYRWGPREIDLDVIFYGDLVLNTPELQIPHSDYQNRRFVLQPLTDIAPEFVAPDTGKPLRKLLSECADQSPLTCIEKTWFKNGIEL